VVIDNASIDGSAAAVDAFAANVRLVANSTNVGFARGVNQGLKATKARYVLVMNPDCRLMAGAVKGLRTVLDAHVRCAITGPRILDPDGSVQGSARGDPDMLTGLFGRTSFLRNIVPFLAVAKRNVVVDEAIRGGDESTVVDWLSGACMLARRDALATVHGFDERFFLYWEDADLCRRIRQRGGRIRFRPDPAVPVVHTVGRSSEGASAEAIRAFHDSAYRYFVTHVASGRFNPARWAAWLLLKGRAEILKAFR
jgi:GT2 family glycosyltransferase